MAANFETELNARREIVKWGKEIYDQGLVKGSGGNLSIRIDDDTILMTPTGYALGHMTEECISKLDINGNLLDGPKPTKEVPLHLAVYKTRPNVNAICHTHSVYAIAYGVTVEPGTYMPICTPSVAAKVGNIKVMEYEPAGSVELGISVEEGIKDSNACILSNHGVVAVGKNMEEAVGFANEVENNAIILALGQEKTRALTDEETSPMLQKIKL